MFQYDPPKLEIFQYLLKSDGIFPNNDRFPVLVYKNAVLFSTEDTAVEMEKLFTKNKWKKSWRDGIYHFHHYHSTAHEVLGVYSGRTRVQVGGEKGPLLNISKGDVLIIPAGVAHKNAENSPDFKCVGAYPAGQDYDMNYGETEERPKAERNIQRLPLPKYDPVFGKKGGVTEHWKLKTRRSRPLRRRRVSI